jgi:hypothetical protein
MSVIAYNNLMLPKNVGINVLEQNQPPLGTQFKSYDLNQAVNYYLLDPFQYNITKFNYGLPEQGIRDNTQETNGLIYKDVDIHKLLPIFDYDRNSVNDFTAQSYHRFEANDGYFNPKESIDNSDLWYYGAQKVAVSNGLGIAGATLNVQEVNHIIFPEPQRGGLDTRNISKYSSVNYIPNVSDSWQSTSGLDLPVNNNERCGFFNYNNFDRDISPYRFDSEYCRNININSPEEGSMPFNPQQII